MDQDIRTVINYPLSGTVEFDIPFDYLARKFVRVSLVSDDNRQLLSNITDYRFVSATRIKLLVGTADYDRLEIRRFTSASERIVDFRDGSVLRATDLNVAQLQSAHIAEEARDAALMAIPQDDAGNLDARNRRIVRLSPGINGTDAINKDQLDTTLGEAGGYLSDMKELDEAIRNFVENFANDPASLRGVVWLYNAGSAAGGETQVTIDKPGDVLAVPCIYINGSRQDVGITYDYDNRTKVIKFKDRALEQGDLLVAMTAEGSVPLADVLMSLAGARYVMTSKGITVEAAIIGLRGDTTTLLDTYLEADGDDYANAFNRALTRGNNVFIPVGRHMIRSTVIVPSGKNIFGTGHASILASPEAAADGSGLITVLRANNATDIVMKDFKVDGGAGAIQVAKNYNRTVRFIGCSRIRFMGMNVSRTSDWATSFEDCTEVLVSDYMHRKSEGTLHGGRDGLHFLDCYGFAARNLDIESHDDCVGITSEKKGTFDGIVDGLRGSSSIASLAIYNEEMAGGVYVSMPCRGLRFNNIYLKEGQKCRTVVRVIGYGAASTVRDISVTNVGGVSSASHAVQFGKVVGLTVSNIVVRSEVATSHGVYFSACSNVKGDVQGSTIGTDREGVHIINSSGVDLTATVRDTAAQAIQLNNSSNVVIRPHVDKTTGNNGLRIVNCANVAVPSGSFVGDNMTYCISQAGNTDLYISTSIRYSGASPRISSKVTSQVLEQPAVVLSLKEAADGTLTVFRAYGCSVTRVAVGRYQVTFDTPMVTSQFAFSLTAAHPGNVRQPYTASAVGVNGFTIGVKDSAGTDTYSEYVRLIAYNY